MTLKKSPLSVLNDFTDKKAETWLPRPPELYESYRKKNLLWWGNLIMEKICTDLVAIRWLPTMQIQLWKQAFKMQDPEWLEALEVIDDLRAISSWSGKGSKMPEVEGLSVVSASGQECLRGCCPPLSSHKSQQSNELVIVSLLLLHGHVLALIKLICLEDLRTWSSDTPTAEWRATHGHRCRFLHHAALEYYSCWKSRSRYDKRE